MQTIPRRQFLKHGAVTGAAALSATTVVAGTGNTAAAATDTSTVTQILGNVNGANIVVYDPGTSDVRSKICIVMMYGSSRETDALPNTSMQRFAALGYRAANCAPEDGYFIDQVQYLNACIDWIKSSISGIEKVVLWGNSRGCNLTSAYQRIAENGAATFQDSKMFLPIPNMTLTPADGIVYADANHGFMVNCLDSLATNLVSDWSVMKRTKRLDPLLPENGYLGDGVAHYDEAFCKEFWRAQARRYNRLLDDARTRMGKIKAGDGMFSDDEPFVVVMGFGNVNSYQLYSHDRRFYSSTRGKCKLLHADGSITIQVVPSLLAAQLPPDDFEAMQYCYRTKVSEFLYLGMYVDEDRFGYDASQLYGVDFDNNFSSANGNARHIAVPTLAIGRTAGSEFEVAEWIYNDSSSPTKDLIFIEGETHAGGNLDPTKYGDVVSLETNYMDQWLQTTYSL